MRYDVFISYSRLDSKLAERICKALSDVGLSYFIDRKGISAGVSFTEVVSKAIDASSVFLFLASANAYKSKFTTAEVFYAFRHKKGGSVIPYLLDNSPMPSELEFLLSTTNWLEMKDNPIETTLVDAVLTALNRSRDTEAVASSKRKKMLWAWILVAVLVCGAGAFLYSRFLRPSPLPMADVERFDRCITASDSLVRSAMMLKNQVTTLETTDRQILDLKEAGRLLSVADSLRLRYAGTSFESSFGADVSSRQATVDAKLDSIFNSWSVFANESYELYRLTGLDSEADNVRECIDHALLVKPDPALEWMKKSVKR